MRTQIVPEQTGPGRERGKCGKMSSSLDDRKNIYNSSYEDDSFETAEESVLAGHRSSHFAMGRRESVFLAESSTSAEEIQESSPFGQTISEGYDESTPSIIATVSANKTGAITEEQDYSDQFESIADNFSEDGSSTKDESISESRKEEVQENFIKKKLAILLSKQANSNTKNYGKKDEDKKMDGYQQENNFCSRKLKIVELGKQQEDNHRHCKRTVSANGGNQQTLQPIDGNKRKIESLGIENLMRKTEKLKEQEFHNPRHCNDCRKMKSDIANHSFLKRKLDIVKRGEFEERLQKHMYQKDSATLLAEIVNSCTKATVPPSEVWEILLHKEENK
ncbi:uncharacterized protein LOC110043070 isoform X2 [Orbicella faveolata]|uniref:uncharacterized protein LOC110043070 isoform X2 n=1 Tax=Orbicella faveolata TaxID=48498 RepID=UPI0009E461C0|nr:uncharacterized protein LOC110043070 isoform X2 [Orbicella faveolata]